ncbi:MAG: peptidase domain-containing ABC transporter [Geitlerinemataceae cyanobacterium]
MTQTSPEIQIVDFLARVSPFDRLGDRQRQQLAASCQLLRYRVGQQILVREKMPTQVLIIYEGQVRILGYDHRSQKSVSLQVLKSGDMLGWLGLVRNTACETAIASTETICLTIPATDFLELLRTQPEWAQAVQNQVAISEVFELLSLELERRADAGSNLKELAFQMWQEATLLHLPPGSVKTTQLDANRLWLISRGPLGEHPTGSRLFSPYLPASLKQEVRLLGLAWPAPVVAEPNDETDDVWDSDLQKPGPIVPVIDYGPPVPPEPEPDPLAPPPKYPYVKGQGPLGSALACFHMLSKHLRLNFRRDSIRKLLEQQIKSRGEITLYGCGTIMPALEMNAQLAKVPSNLVGRLKAPAMIKWQESFAILYTITEKEIVLAVPEVGIMRQTPEQIAEMSGEVLEILLLQPPAAKTEKFDIWWFVPSLGRYKKVLTEVFVASFFVQLFGLANPILTQVVIDKVLGQRSIETLNVLGVFMILVALFEALLTSLRTYLFVDTTNRIDLDLGSKVIDHLFRLPLKYFDTRRVGDISGRVNELANIRQFITGTALTVVLNALFSVIYIAVMLTYSMTLTFVALATVPFFTVLILFVSPIVQRLLRKRAERYADAQSYLVETLNGIQTVKAQNIELTSRWNWYERYARFMNAGFRTTLTNTAASSIAGFLNKISGLLLLWVGAYMVLENKLTLGQLIAFRIIAGNVTGALLQFVQVWQSFQEVGMSIERLRDILNSETESDDSDRMNIPLPSIEGAVQFDDVCFRFNPTGPLQVSNVNLEFAAGTFVGVVGESGSGKSTTMKLLQRLYPPTSGRILIDDFDISKVELYSLRRQIGVVLQDTLLFNNTVKANIALNNPEATDEEIINAAKVAAAHEFIMTLQNGYNTVVGERGSSLSGGQRQRIAIARTVLQQPRLLILDEATSALDYNLESLVCRNLIEEFKGRTVFFITHRLPTVQQSDTIIMMDKGSLVEQGTHQELMALQGRYYCLYQQQESQL